MDSLEDKRYFLEHINPKAKRFLNTCSHCGRQGYRPSIEEEGFGEDGKRRFMRKVLQRHYGPLPLDESGRCEVCVGLARKGD